MVLDRLGFNLKDVLIHCDGKFSLKTVLLLADVLIALIAYIHSKNVIHGDVRPHNILIGTGKRTATVYVIDFDLAETFCDPQDASTPCYEDKAPTETALNTSKNSHLIKGKSRSNDLESLGYVLIYLLGYDLHCQNLKSDKGYSVIKGNMVATPIKTLCAGLPGVFAEYLDYTRSLGREKKPDYDYLRKLFNDFFDREGFKRDGVFDWVIEENGGTPKEVVNPHIEAARPHKRGAVDPKRYSP